MDNFNVRVIGRHDLESRDQHVFGELVCDFLESKDIATEWDDSIYVSGYGSYRDSIVLRGEIKKLLSSQEFKTFVSEQLANTTRSIVDGKFNKILLPR
jgi:hypothetical protein